MSFIEMIDLEAASFEKLQGKKPKYLILSGEYVDKFYSEFGQYIIKTEGAKFESPIDGHRQFNGITVVHNSVTYGGSFNFSFGT